MGLFPKGEISVVEISDERRSLIRKKYGITCTQDLSAVKKAQRVLLAVKPQMLNELLREIDPFLRDEQMIISIIAGKTIANIQDGLRVSPAIVRVMPNTPALVGKGFSGVCFNENVKPRQKKEAVRILKCVGRVLIFDEKMMNAVTAVSGSGPAYVFSFIEAFEEGAVSLGFSRAEAEELIHTTVWGALQLLKKTGEKPEILRKKVTSKGGTTEAALRVLEEKNIKKILAIAMKAAERRGIELSQS